MLFASKSPTLNVQLTNSQSGRDSQGESYIIASPLYIKFSGGSYVAKTRRVAELLLHHRSFGRLFHCNVTKEDVRSGAWKKLFDNEEAGLIPESGMKSDSEIKKIVAKAKRKAPAPKVIVGTRDSRQESLSGQPEPKASVSVTEILKDQGYENGK